MGIKKTNIVLIGGGNHAQYCIDIIEKENKYNIVGIVDSINDIGSKVYGYTVIGRQENLWHLSLEYDFIEGIVTIGDNWSRKKVSSFIQGKYPWFKFVNAIHPSVIIGNNVSIGTGIVSMAGVIINPGAKIADGCFFATGTQIEHDCTIENYTSISAGSVLGGHVYVQAFAAVCLGVTIFDRVTIGYNAVVGSGSLVTKDVGMNSLYYGNPAKFIRHRTEGEKFLK